MKRVPLKPSKPLRRKVEMSRRERADLFGVAGKPKRVKYTGPSKATKALLRQRSGGVCEIGLICLGDALAVDPSHRLAKGSGGTGNPDSSAASNNVAACRRDHDGVEADPASAYELGLKIRHGVARPCEVPVYLFTHNGWVLLDDQGGYRPAPFASYGTSCGLLPVITITPDGHEFPDDGVVVDAVDRWGHIDCGGWSYEVDGPCTCRCDRILFVVAVSP